MKNYKLIAEKQRELINLLDEYTENMKVSDSIKRVELFEQINKLEEEKEQPIQSADFMQMRDLTDEEWLKLPKEEILHLYKNCYKMLLEYAQQRSMPTDEEIEKAAPYTDGTHTTMFERIGWIEGAKAMRDGLIKSK